MRQNLIFAIAGSPDDFTIDARVIHGLCVATFAATLVALPVNHFLELNATLNLMCLIASLLAGIAWLFGRVYHLSIICLSLLMFSQMLALTCGYIFNAGAAGPVIFFYMALIPFYLFILENKAGIICSIVLFINLVALYLLDLSGRIIPDGYRSHAARIIDLFAFQCLCITLLVIIILFAKKLLAIEKGRVMASSKAKTQFLANMSHEIRTPMNAILGMNELALSLSTDEQQKNWLRASQVAAQHLLSLMEDVLDVSSIDQGKLIITPQTVHVQDLVIEVINILKPLANAKQLSLDLSLAENMPTHIQADPVRLRQVLVNLINNAIKFTDNGGVTIIITQEHAALHFSICDTGLGIPAKEQQKIFEVFTQAENIDAFRHKGFGLGLAISKQLIEKMGGSLHLESQQGVGSTFFFSLPLTAADEKKSDPDAMPTILLVEDNEINIEVARIFLIKNNFTVDVAINGQKALDLLVKRKYAAVLMDLEMPVMDGFEATIALRTGLAGSLNQSTPVIALTAHALAEYREKSFKVGMSGFIAKPINGALLVSEIHRILIEKKY